MTGPVAVPVEVPFGERVAVAAQHLLPKQALTQWAGQFASVPRGALTTRVIERFVRRYGVNMSEAAYPEASHYKTFNEFFTRELRPGARPLAQADLICPVDGAVSQFGAVVGSQIFQAKGHHYSADALLGGDAKEAVNAKL